MTVFIVSQRAASVRQADQILVLDDGRLAGAGTHETLMRSCPVYQEIYYSQFPEERPAPPPFPASDGRPAPDTGVFPPFPAAPEIPASAPDHAGTNPPRDPSRYRRPRRADRWKEDWSE